MNTEIMKLEDINPAPYNPRVPMKDGDTQYEALKKSIGRFGLVEPLVVNKATGTLVGGHQRLSALKASGATEAEVVIVDLPLEKEKLLNIALNKVEGIWDFEKLDDLFRELDPEDIPFTGFSMDEIGNLYDDEPLDIEYEEQDISFGDDAEEKFTVYLSFPTKEDAEEWMADRGIEGEFSNKRALTVTMKGSRYGTEH